MTTCGVQGPTGRGPPASGGVFPSERRTTDMAAWHDEPWAQAIWFHGKTSRRRWLGLSASAAGALGAMLLVPSPWRAAFGQAKPYRIGSLQPLTGVAAAGGRMALVGTDLAVQRINKS